MSPTPPSSIIQNPPANLLVRRELHPKAAVPADETAAVIDFRSSDETLDRYSERISVAGWQLDNYRKNPVVQNAHSYSSLSDTIGKSLITEVRGEPGTRNSEPGTYLFQRILFAIEENPMAKVAYGLYKGGFLNAVSVGFIPLQWEDGTKEEGYRRKYIEQELVEVSAVSIPANPNALTLALKSGAVEAGDVRELYDLLKHFCSEAARHPLSLSSSTEERAGVRSRSSDHSTQNPINHQHFRNKEADRIPDTSALGSAIDEARLLHLTKQMNEIRAVLRRAQQTTKNYGNSSHRRVP